MLQDPICMIGRPLGRLSSKSQAFCGLGRQPINSPAVASMPSIKLVHQKFEEIPLASEGSWDSFLRTGSACLRLARLHTLMAWAIFPAPAIYTIVLYHSSTAMTTLDALSNVMACMRSSFIMFLCVLSYRAAGLAWDDLIDRDFDARVTRSMTRPLPAGDISVDGALLYIIFQIGCTIVLLQALTGPEVFLSFIVSGSLFGIYPYLKRWTNYTQCFGALLIAMGVIQGWLTCATQFNPVPGFTPGWSHAIAIIQRDWVQLLPIFLMEFTYELAHELIYGCQDTAEDVMIGLHSLSILCGYEKSRTLGTALVGCYCYFLALSGKNSNMFGWQCSLIPPLVLLYLTSKLNLSAPSSCGKWAVSAIKVKVLVTLILFFCFLQKELDSFQSIRSFLNQLASLP